MLTEKIYLHVHDVEELKSEWAFNSEASFTFQKTDARGPLLSRITEAKLIYSINALRDFKLLKELFQENGISIDEEKFVDVIALLKVCSLPVDLQKAKNALGLCCSCSGGAEELREICEALPLDDLNATEKRVLMLTNQMNAEGIPVASNEAECINAVVKDYKEDYQEALRKIIERVMLSQGRTRLTKLEASLDSLNQLEKLKEWFNVNGVEIPNLKNATVDEWLTYDLPEDMREMLLLRQELSSVSVSKYDRIEELSINGRIHDGLEYHAATTGRWGGKGFQLHNLPSAGLVDKALSDGHGCWRSGVAQIDKDAYVEQVINDFRYQNRIERPLFLAKCLIRSMVKAPEDSLLLVADYSAIENRVISWIAEDSAAVEIFRSGKDQYTDMAAWYFKIPYTAVKKSQREIGKKLVIGCCFGMGAKTFKESYDKEMSLPKYSHLDKRERVISLVDAERAVNSYREKYFKVVQLWNGLRTALVDCVKKGGKHKFGMITFSSEVVKETKFVSMLLPSGRKIYYVNPRIEFQTINVSRGPFRAEVITYDNHRSTSRKLASDNTLIPGRIAENATQAIARDIMAQGLLNIADSMKSVTLVGTVHDEAIGIIKKADVTETTLKEFCGHLCSVDWAEGLPLNAVGYLSQRYRK